MESLESMLEELDTPNPKESGPELEKQPEAQEPNPQKVKEKKKKILIAVLIVLVLLIAAIIGGVVWWNTRPAMDDTTQYWFDKFAEDGTLAGKTRQELQGMLDKIMDEGMVNVSMNSVVVFDDGTAEGSLGVENISANRYYVRVVLKNDADGSVLYESQGLKPGQYIDKIKLNKDLPAGEYACTATEIITDPETLEDIGQVDVAVKLIVKE